MRSASLEERELRSLEGRDKERVLSAENYVEEIKDEWNREI